MKVLVVDDATSVRQRLTASFKRAEGVTEVVEAETGEEALQVFDGLAPDLVTLDLMLPGMSGLEVLEEMHRRDPTVKIVVFTNYPYPAFRRRCLELGAFQFFGKSTEVDRILTLAREEGPSEEPSNQKELSA
jgi:DNA-binding NarL/FixJ family response regulator